jgi:hypothetical protein
MLPAQQQERRTDERDRWLGRARGLRRAIAAGAVALVLAFGALAAQASSKHDTQAASTATPSASAPQTTSQPPAVTSGGS